MMHARELTAKEYSDLRGWSFEAGMVSRRLREFYQTGILREMPGVIEVRRPGREWRLLVLVSWIEGKEASNE